jgi:hypothetical protein
MINIFLFKAFSKYKAKVIAASYLTIVDYSFIKALLLSFGKNNISYINLKRNAFNGLLTISIIHFVL